MPAQQLSRVNNDDDEVKWVRIANAIKLKYGLNRKERWKTNSLKWKYSK
jgi:hypothetical protein